MKTVNYPFEVLVQNATVQNKQSLVESYKTVLESNKDFMRKCDYICYSIASIDTRVKAIDEEFDYLTKLKITLLEAKQIALEAGADAFAYYGISKLEGSVFESITVSKPVESTKQKLVIVNEKALIDGGFFKTVKVIDTQQLLEEYSNGTYTDFIKQHTRLENVFEPRKAQLVVNRRVMNQEAQSNLVA